MGADRVRNEIGGVFSTVRGLFHALMDRFWYQTTVLLEASLFTKLAMLWLTSATLVLAGASMLVVVSSNVSWGEALFRAYALLHNAPGTSVWEYSGAQLALSNVLFITGILTFAVTIGTVSSSIQATFEEVWKADHKVVETGHVVIINWSSSIVPVLRQVLAGQRDGQRQTMVVVLAQRDIQWMRDIIHSELGYAYRNRIIVRSGNPSSIRHLEKVSVGSAHYVLVLTPTADDDVSSHGSLKSLLQAQLACIRSLQQIHASRNRPHHSGAQTRDFKPQGVVVSPLESAPDMLLGFTLVSPTSFQQDVLAVSVLQRGLTTVYQEILDQTRGAELYLFDPASCGCSHLYNQTLDDLGAYFKHGVVLGWLDQTEDGKTVRLNPAHTERLPHLAPLVLLTHNSRAIGCSAAPRRIQGLGSDDAGQSGTGGGDKRSCGTPNSIGSGNNNVANATAANKRVLILNFVDQWPMLHALDTHLHAGKP